jgi:hypothetical protein
VEPHSWDLSTSNSQPGKDGSYSSIHCNCGSYHDGANEKFGCGASWLLAGKIDLSDNPQRKEPSFEPVAEENLGIYWPAAEAIATAAPEALTRFQAKAGTWQSGIAGIVTAAGLATLAGARTTVQGIESPWDTLVIWAIIIATAASAVNVAISVW